MLGDLVSNMAVGILTAFPVLALPAGFSAGISFLVNLVGFINVWLPLSRLVPIFGFVLLVRNWNIIVSALRFVLRFIPFIG